MRSTSTAAIGLFSDKQEKVTDNPNIIYVVQDTDTHLTQPRNWRHPGMITACYQGDTTGLDRIWASTSAAPSCDHFPWIADQIKGVTSGSVGKIVIVDLREECHAYLNGQAITHATEHNWVNRGKSDQASLETEDNWIRSISEAYLLENVLTPDQHKSLALSDGTTIKVDTISNEKQVAESAGFEYKRFLVSDHMAPRPHVIDQFVAFVKELPKDTWLHLHCRGGEGRSTSFIVMLDMLKNANTVSCDEIIQRHASIPPFYYLPQMTRRCKELTVYYQERYAFIQSFYLFAKELSQQPDLTWSAWESINRPANMPGYQA